MQIRSAFNKESNGIQLYMYEAYIGLENFKEVYSYDNIMKVNLNK